MKKAMLLLAVLLLSQGCTSAQFSADVAAVKSDAHAAATVTLGLATQIKAAVAANPSVVTMLVNATADLATRTGVSAADAAMLRTINPTNVAAHLDEVIAVSTKVAALAAPTAAPAPQCPGDDPFEDRVGP